MLVFIYVTDKKWMPHDIPSFSYNTNAFSFLVTSCKILVTITNAASESSLFTTVSESNFKKYA